MLSTQVSATGLRLRLVVPRCLRQFLRGGVDAGFQIGLRLGLRGSMLEVSRDAIAAGEEQLVNCAAEYIKYCSICTVTLDPYGDLPFTSWGSLAVSSRRR